MSATATAPDIAIFAPLRGRRSAYDQVVVCPGYDGVAEYDKPAVYTARVQDFPAPAVAVQKTGTAAADELRISWLVDKVLKEQDEVRRQLTAKQPYYEGIDPQHVVSVVSRLAIALWQWTNPTQLTFTLTYEQSLHVRATVPQGAVHISVLLTPGLDPSQYLGDREEEDNTVISVFGPDGQWQAGTEGPLLLSLSRLPTVVAQAAETRG